MAAANFFDRALMSAAQALQGADPAQVQAELDSHVVELAWDRRAAQTVEGQAALDLGVRLLARLYPILRLSPLDAAAARRRASLEGLALSINPAIELSRTAESTVRLVFGDTAVAAGPVTIYAGSNGWLAKASTRRPQGIGSTLLPFGAGGAACLGAANVFRAIFASRLPSAALDETAALSMLDFSTGCQATQGPAMLDVDLGLTPLVGVGAIGNGVIWALARAPGLKGVLHLIDHEQVELSNLQRYVLATQTDVGRVKVEVAREALVSSSSSLMCMPFTARWDEYQAGRGHAVLKRVLVALDTARDRIAVQAALPGRALNAWTQVGDLGISRHDFLGEEACLACLYLPKGAAPHEDELIAQALGLPVERPVLLDLRNRLIGNEPVGEAFVRETAARLDAPADTLLRFANDTLRQFYVKAVCGGLLLKPNSGRPLLEAPLAFQSAMAGIMLAAETVADAGSLRATPLVTKTILDITRPLASHLNVRVLKSAPSAGPRCICQDQDFVTVYRQKHGMPEPEPAMDSSRRYPPKCGPSELPL